MCELPARSMPGSEMLFVEKTRIRGTKAGASSRASPATDTDMGRSLLAPISPADALAPAGPSGCLYFWRRTKTRSYPSATRTPRKPWPTFPDHAPMSLLVTGSLDQISMTAPTGTVPMPFLASRSGPGQAAPRASTILSAVMASSSVSVAMAGMVPFSLVNEAVGGRRYLGDEATGGDDFGALDEVRCGDPAAVDAWPADQEGPAEVPVVPQELREGREAVGIDAVGDARLHDLHAVGLEAEHDLDVGGERRTAHHERDGGVLGMVRTVQDHEDQLLGAHLRHVRHVVLLCPRRRASRRPAGDQMKRIWLPSAAIRKEATPPAPSTIGSSAVTSRPSASSEPEHARTLISPISLAWRNVSSQGRAPTFSTGSAGRGRAASYARPWSVEIRSVRNASSAQNMRRTLTVSPIAAAPAASVAAAISLSSVPEKRTSDSESLTTDVPRWMGGQETWVRAPRRWGRPSTSSSCSGRSTRSERTGSRPTTASHTTPPGPDRPSRSRRSAPFPGWIRSARPRRSAR